MYTADFETTTDLNDCRVWAWAICEIGNCENVFYGNSISSFIDFLYYNKKNVYYFHNLKFDGEFIIHHLLTNGFNYSREAKLQANCFNALISDTGVFYTIKINFDNVVTVEIRDSMKLLNYSVSDIAHAFNLPINKLEIDYNANREIDHKLTQEEQNYIKNDVQIMALALEKIFDMGYTKLTQGSCALADYKKIIGKKRFDACFPAPEYDEDIRKSYKGGFVYLNPIYADRDVFNGNVLDVNSLYPSRMRYCYLPFGEGKYYNGEYKKDERYPLYIQTFRCEFEIKEGKLPTIQLKGNMRFLPTEYVTSSNGDTVTLCLTSVDLALFFDHYDVYNIEYLHGWKYRQSDTLFNEYVDKWMSNKIDASKSGNATLRNWAKIMLNSLYGKFALNPICARKEPYLENGIVKYKTTEKEKRKPLYLPIGTFITAYARDYTIRASQKIKEYSIAKYNKDLYVYSDTDSIHTLLPLEDIKTLIEVDPNNLGAWKHEAHFTRARFLRAKTYAEEIDGEMHITCAGLPDRCKPQVTWENFHPGAVYTGKLTPKHVPGGQVLVESEFSIRL